MNTKVKVGIASVIVAALVALIVLDQKTTPKTDAPAEATGLVAPPPASPNETVTRMRQHEIDNLIKKAKELGAEPANDPAVKPAPSFKNPDPPAGGKEPSPTPRGEEYVIQQGDTLETIAEAKYGSRKFAAFITESNPEVKPNALRVGKKLVLPPKPEKKAEEAVAAKPSTGGEAPVAVVNNQKVYTVQAGDTLSGISTKVYNTSRHVEKIYEANRDRIADPSTLYVGTKLVMPDLPVKGAAGAPTGTVPTATPAPASGKTHAVQQGESLWKIAEKYAGEKGVGILEMIQTLVQANPDKLKDEKTMLRLGWQLVVPE